MNPLKLYIQDIFRAERSDENKYVYTIFGIKFKNVMLHGVVTSIYNTTANRTNLEISDPTGCVQVYYDSTKNNTNIAESSIKDLVRSLSVVSRNGNSNAVTMSTLLNSIENKQKYPLNFQLGSYISVVGDIFLDDLKGVRMISAYQCRTTSVDRDIVWLEELRYLYDKYYLNKL